MNAAQKSSKESKHDIKFVYTGQQLPDIPKDITHLVIHPWAREILPATFQECTSLLEVECLEGVKIIGKFAFQKCTKLRSISVSSSTFSIGFRAFALCASLSDVKLQERLSFIGGQAFSGCISLIKMSIPSTVESIGEHAFDACKRLVEVNFQHSVSARTNYTLGRGVFFNCESLLHVQLAEGLSFIPVDAFNACQSLRTMSVPKSVAEIGENAFDGCISLAEVSFQEGLRLIGENAFDSCIELRTLSFPSTLVSIEGSAFQGCEGLLDVEFAEGLESIGEEAFFDCESLSAVSLPRSLKIIGEDAFINCTSLLSVEFPNGIIAKVSEGCFFECASLVNVSIPASLTVDVYDSFSGCGFLEDENGYNSFCHKVKGRFSQLAVHDACYNSSIATVDELLLALDSSTMQKDVTDAFGMTPFHIIATSAMLRPDFMEILLGRYPLDILSCKDNHKKTMMDYLLLHKSTKAIPLIKAVLRHFLEDCTAGWVSDEQRQDLFSLVDSICGDGNSTIRRWSFVEVSKAFTSCMQLEITSIVEMALWKLKITQMEEEEPTGTVDRAFCRFKSGADIVLQNVMMFVWDNQSANCFAGLLPIGQTV